MKLLANLLASVSVSAILAAGPLAAEERGGLVIEATGAYLMGDNRAAAGRIGSIFLPAPTDVNIGGMTGGYGAVRVGKQIMPMWDVTGRFAVTSLDGSASYTLPGLPPDPGPPPFPGFADKLGTITSELDFQTLDLEVGYAPALDDNFDLRFFAGIRGLHYTNSLNDTEDKLGILSGTMQSHEFYGAGPRVGIEFEKRFDEAPLGFSGLVAGAVAFGSERRTTTSISPGPTTTTDEAKAIVDLEAQLALDLHIADQTKLSLGYRGEYLSGVNDFSFSGAPAEGQLSHGPFLKFKAVY